MSRIVVFTDGACRGNPGHGGWAWAVDPDQHPEQAGRHECGFVPDTTSQRMELTAVLKAVEAFRAEACGIEVVSDSAYVVNCFLQSWYERWLRNGWVTGAGKPVANRDLWEPLVEVASTRRRWMVFRKVRGHSGDPMNDLVDRLAREASHRG